jgi:hypothetical protein
MANVSGSAILHLYDLNKGAIPVVYGPTEDTFAGCFERLC